MGTIHSNPDNRRVHVMNVGVTQQNPSFNPGYGQQGLGHILQNPGTTQQNTSYPSNNPGYIQQTSGSSSHNPGPGNTPHNPSCIPPDTGSNPNDSGYGKTVPGKYPPDPGCNKQDSVYTIQNPPQNPDYDQHNPSYLQSSTQPTTPDYPPAVHSYPTEDSGPSSNQVSASVYQGYPQEPPPPYEPPQYTEPAEGLTPLSYQVEWNDKPRYVQCGKCHKYVMSRQDFKAGSLVYFSAFFLFFCGLCWMPFLISSLKDIEHKCPNCQEVFGTHRQM